MISYLGSWAGVGSTLIPVTSTGTCLIYGTLLNAQGSPFVGAQIYFVISTTPALSSTGYGISPLPISVITTVTGYFEVTLIRNIDVVATIPSIGYRQKIHVPDASMAGLFQLAYGIVITDSTTEVPDPNETNW